MDLTEEMVKHAKNIAIKLTYGRLRSTEDLAREVLQKDYSPLFPNFDQFIRPAKKTITNAIKNEKKKMGMGNPDQMAELRRWFDDQEFLVSNVKYRVYSAEGNPKRQQLMIWAHPKLILKVRQKNTALLDGTFSVVPRIAGGLFQQVTF